MKLEFKQAYRFPFLEVIVAFVTFLTLGSGLGGSRSPFEAIWMHSTFVTATCFIFQSLVIPILIGFRVSGSKERGMMETMLTLPIRHYEMLTSMLFTHLVIQFTLSALSSCLWLYVKIPTYAMDIPWLPLLMAILVQTTLIASITLLIAIVIKRTLLSVTAGVIFWYIVKFLTAEEYIPRPYKHMLPPDIGGLILAVLAGYKKLPWFIYGEFVIAELPISSILTGSAIIILGCLLISYILFCKLIEPVR